MIDAAKNDPRSPGSPPSSPTLRRLLRTTPVNSRTGRHDQRRKCGPTPSSAWSDSDGKTGPSAGPITSTAKGRRLPRAIRRAARGGHAAARRFAETCAGTAAPRRRRLVRLRRRDLAAPARHHAPAARRRCARPATPTPGRAWSPPSSSSPASEPELMPALKITRRPSGTPTPGCSARPAARSISPPAALRPADPADRISRATSVAPAEDTGASADCPLWRALPRSRPPAATRPYKPSCSTSCGYALTGETCEHVAAVRPRRGRQRQERLRQHRCAAHLRQLRRRRRAGPAHAGRRAPPRRLAHSAEIAMLADARLVTASRDRGGPYLGRRAPEAADRRRPRHRALPRPTTPSPSRRASS